MYLVSYACISEDVLQKSKLLVFYLLGMHKYCFFSCRVRVVLTSACIINDLCFSHLAERHAKCFSFLCNCHVRGDFFGITFANVFYSCKLYSRIGDKWEC